MNRRLFRSRTYSNSVQPSYRAESLAIFAAHSTQLSNAQKFLVDTQVGLLIDDGSWAAADVIVFPMLVTEQQSLINWKNPGVFNGTAVNFASSFVTKVGYPAVSANGTYIRTGFTPYSNGTNWVQNNAKALCYVKDNVVDDGRALGGISNGNTLLTTRSSSATCIGRINAVTTNAPSNTDGSGLFSVSTADGANLVCKRNNSVLGTTSYTATGVTNSELLVYAFNDAGAGTVTPNYYMNNNTIQCYAFGSSAMNDATFKTVRDNLAAGL